MGFPWRQKKGERGAEKKGKEKQPAKKWWGNGTEKDSPRSSNSERPDLSGAGDRRREGYEANIQQYGSSLVPHYQVGQASSSRQDLEISPALSQASTLSETDEQYLATQARSGTPRPRPEFDRGTFAGAFEPVRQRPQTKYPIPPLTKEQLDALTGAYAPPAPLYRKQGGYK